MTSAPQQRTKRDWAGSLALCYRLLAGVACAGVSFLLLYTSTDGHRRAVAGLSAPDLLLGLSTRTVLVLAGVLHAGLGAYFFLAQDRIGQGLIGLWVALNSLVYRIGVLWMGAVAPFPVLRAMGRRLGVEPASLDLWWKVLIGGLLIGGSLLLLSERQRIRKLRAAAFLKRWREMRERAPVSAPGRQKEELPAAPGALAGASPPERTGLQASTAAVPAEFKFSCPACGQHLRCGPSYAGKHIACPGCRKEILVPITKL